MDTDNSGSISYGEFVAATVEANMQLSENKL